MKQYDPLLNVSKCLRFKRIAGNFISKSKKFSKSKLGTRRVVFGHSTLD